MRYTPCKVLFLASLIHVCSSAAVATTPSIFWTDSAKKTVERSDLDGSSGQLLVTSGLDYPEGIALHPGADRMYWADGVLRAILSARLDGGDLDTVIAGVNAPAGIALDTVNSKLYWTDVAVGRVHRANLDGTGSEQLLESPGHVRAIALDIASGKMYFTSGGNTKVQRANLDGTALEDLVTGQHSPVGIVLDAAAGKMYWADNTAIRRADLDGLNVEVVVSLPGPFGLAIDLSAAKLYWTNLNSPYIQRSNLDGSGVEDLVASGPMKPRALALLLPDPTTGLEPVELLPARNGAVAEPNPFHHTTRIRLLPGRGPANAVAIYDIRGRIVRTLIPSGSADDVTFVDWDGLTDAGTASPNGVYFAKLNDSRGSKAVRLIRLR